MGKMAILVDGGFYLKRANSLRGEKTPAARVDELSGYCKSHYKHEDAELYRIFYYDCDPVGKKAFHPLLGRTIDLSKTDDYRWKMAFFDELSRKRKVAIRKGQPLEGSCEYVMKPSVSNGIAMGKTDPSSLTEEDFYLHLEQKGVDVRIGLDVALIAHEGYADQIVLITGDSDFVPVAKYARRHGIDFIIDPMWHNFKPELGVHVDGMYTPWKNPRKPKPKHGQQSSKK